MKEYFPQIGKIPFEGKDSKNPMAFHYYDAEKMVMGRPMKDWLRFAMAWWHTLCAEGGDQFGGGTKAFPWNEGETALERAKHKADAGFEIMEKLGIPYFCFHDVDLICEGESVEEYDQLEFATPEINPDDIVLFGSFFALNPVVRPQVAGFLEYAKSRGAILYYDVNFRSSHQHEIMKITPNLIENLEHADFVRGSHEDFGILYKKPEADKVYNAEISFYCKKFICTQGAEPVEVRAENGFAKSYPSKKMKPVSTIGAGDNFNAGFVFGLIKDGITREDIDRGLSEAQWDSLLVSAQEFSTECCKDIYNYVSKEFGEEKKKEL